MKDGRNVDPGGALPELSVRHLGMHIGGEPNTEESKRPWLSDIESQMDAIMRCYRFVDTPLEKGSFGLDLFVGKDGGHPTVRAVRQKLGGEEFSSCVERAFREIDFHRPERPTVLSYSLFYEFR